MVKHHCTSEEYGGYIEYNCGYGCAVVDCQEHEDGTLWVDNGEYANPVNYCPFCGYEAKVKFSTRKANNE